MSPHFSVYFEPTPELIGFEFEKNDCLINLESKFPPKSFALLFIKELIKKAESEKKGEAMV